MMGLEQFNLMDWVSSMLIFVIAITVHEFSHAYVADRLGDPTPRAQGRVTLNPTDHLDPLGTLLAAVSTATGIGIGWGRPVLVNYSNFRSPRWDPLKVAIAGPISNVLQAGVFAIAVRLCDAHGWLADNEAGYNLLRQGVWLNLALALFNLIPIPPLDGSKVLSSLLKTHHAQSYDRVMATWGMPLFFLMVLTHATSYIIGPPMQAAFRVFVGD